MKTTQENIRKRLKSLEKKVDSFDVEDCKDTRQFLDLAEEYRQIMDDYNDSLLDSDLDFLLR